MAITNHTTPTKADAIPCFLPNAAFTVGTPTAQNIPEAKSCDITNTLETVHINMRTSNGYP